MLSPDQRRRNRSEERKSFQDRGSRSEVDASSSQAIYPEELELLSTTPDRSFYHQARPQPCQSRSAHDLPFSEERSPGTLCVRGRSFREGT